MFGEKFLELFDSNRRGRRARDACNSQFEGGVADVMQTFTAPLPGGERTAMSSRVALPDEFEILFQCRHVPRLFQNQANVAITELYLADNVIGDEGAKALADSLKATLVISTACSSPVSLVTLSLTHWFQQL